MSAKRKPISGRNRRRSKRRTILEAFGVGFVLKKMPDVRLVVRDMSRTGVAIILDSVAPPLKDGQLIFGRFYFNSTLSVSLCLVVKHVRKTDTTTVAGCQINRSRSKGWSAYQQFLALLENF